MIETEEPPQTNKPSNENIAETGKSHISKEDLENEKRYEMEEQIRKRVTTLSIEQQNAIDLLALGRCDQFVADKVGVARQTVTKWRLYHPQFKAELGRRREEIWAFSADKIRLLLPQAIEIVERSLDDPKNPDRLKLAVEILKQTGIFTTFRRPQLTDAEDIIIQGIPSGKERMHQTNEFEKTDAMKRIYEKLEDPEGVIENLEVSTSNESKHKDDAEK